MKEDVSSNKEKEMRILKTQVNEIVHAIKYQHNYAEAGALLIKYNLSFEKLIHSTVKLSTEDLAHLADKIISQK
jgi:hypothetical protein